MCTSENRLKILLEITFAEDRCSLVILRFWQCLFHIMNGLCIFCNWLHYFIPVTFETPDAFIQNNLQQRIRLVSHQTSILTQKGFKPWPLTSYVDVSTTSKSPGGTCVFLFFFYWWNISNWSNSECLKREKQCIKTLKTTIARNPSRHFLGQKQ